MTLIFFYINILGDYMPFFDFNKRIPRKILRAEIIEKK